MVERVLTAHGITRGAEKAGNPAAAISATTPALQAMGEAISVPVPEAGPSHPAARAGLSPGPIVAEVPAQTEASKPEVLPIIVAEFVSESEVRQAMGRGVKIFIGPKTIVTPSARDLASDNDIFVITDLVPSPQKPSR